MRAPAKGGLWLLTQDPQALGSAKRDSVSRGSAAATGSGEAQNAEIKQQLDALLRDDQALRNVDQGNVPPVLYDIERDAAVFFRPNWNLTDGDAQQMGSFGKTLKESLKAIVKGYASELKRHTEGNSPSAADRSPPSSLEVNRSIRRSAAKDTTQGYSALICATLDKQGQPQLAIRQGSKRRAFDTLAREALRQAIVRRTAGHPPLAPMHVCYTFAVSFSRVPPLPALGFDFDEVNLSLDWFYPLKKIVKATAKLSSVQYLAKNAWGQ
jgi:hypothetical protein